MHYTLSPMPYTPIPYTLLPAPYAPCPYALYPKPYALYGYTLLPAPNAPPLPLPHLQSVQAPYGHGDPALAGGAREWHALVAPPAPVHPHLTHHAPRQVRGGGRLVIINARLAGPSCRRQLLLLLCQLQFGHAPDGEGRALDARVGR